MKNNFLILSFVLLSLFLTGCGKPNIENECSLNGVGVASCDFRNTGEVKGDGCYTAIVMRTHQPYEDYRIRVNEDNGYRKILQDSNTEWSDAFGSFIESRGKICSGIVEPKDVVQRSKNIKPFFFVDDNGIEVNWDLQLFCQIDDDDDWKTLTSGAWYRGCSIVFSPVEDG